MTRTQRDKIDLEAHLRALCLSVACLDDAGLPVQHKSAIAKAKVLREFIKERNEERKGHVAR